MQSPCLVVLDPYGRFEDMTNKRFTVETAVVDQFTDSYVGWFVRDNSTGLPVGDGKGGFIHVYGSRVGLAVDICDEMNRRVGEVVPLRESPEMGRFGLNAAA